MGQITFKGSPISTIGSLPEVGTRAPDFVVTNNDLSEIHFKDYLGKKIVLNIFPSLDTTTCATAMRRLNDIAAQFKNLLVLCISADLPFAQQRFCIADHLKNIIPVSIFRHTEFGHIYGVTIIDGPLAGLLSRAIVVIDETGKVIYTEQVKELADEPNYSGMVAAIQKST